MLVAILITGSIATDHLMSFPGKFSDSLVADKIDKVSLSFLVEELQIRRGGVAPNIAFGMGCLGLSPVLVGAVGPDFADYESWLQRHGVDTRGVHVSDSHHTARFVCTTDTEQNQIASFYPGAMSEARNIELKPIVDQVGGADVVLIGANDPEGMRRHTDECRFRGYPFAADPSQQLARMDGDDIKPLIEGAEYLFTNEYEAALIEQKTSWTAADLAAIVNVRIQTAPALSDVAATPFSLAFRKRRARPTRPVWEMRSVPGSSPANRGVFLTRGQPRSGPWSPPT